MKSIYKLLTVAIIVSATLSGCSTVKGWFANIGTSNDPLSQENLAKYASQVQDFNVKLAADVANLNAGGAQVLAQVGKDACGAIAMADPLFQMVAPVVGVDPKGLAVDAAVMVTANALCPKITDTSATLASDVGTVLELVTKQHNALASVAPTVAAATTAPAPSK